MRTDRRVTLTFRGLDRPFLRKTLEIQRLYRIRSLRLRAVGAAGFWRQIFSFFTTRLAPTLVCRKIDYRNGKRTDLGDSLVRSP
jgi:hypothetical protein